MSPKKSVPLSTDENKLSSVADISVKNVSSQSFADTDVLPIVSVICSSEPSFTSLTTGDFKYLPSPLEFDSAVFLFIGGFTFFVYDVNGSKPIDGAPFDTSIVLQMHLKSQVVEHYHHQEKIP